MFLPYVSWLTHLGTTTKKRTQTGTKYPVTVRFEKVNYAGVSTNNYGLDEVEEV